MNMKITNSIDRDSPAVMWLGVAALCLMVCANTQETFAATPSPISATAALIPSGTAQAQERPFTARVVLQPGRNVKMSVYPKRLYLYEWEFMGYARTSSRIVVWATNRNGMVNTGTVPSDFAVDIARGTGLISPTPYSYGNGRHEWVYYPMLPGRDSVSVTFIRADGSRSTTARTIRVEPRDVKESGSHIPPKKGHVHYNRAINSKH